MNEKIFYSLSAEDTHAGLQDVMNALMWNIADSTGGNKDKLREHYGVLNQGSVGVFRPDIGTITASERACTGADSFRSVVYNTDSGQWAYANEK